MKQVYELNLPPIEEILLDTFNGFNDDKIKYNYIVTNDIEKMKCVQFTILGFLCIFFSPTFYIF